ncbi:hypothetical protein J4440_05825 [Candidatus Woesearchaeota archaeon]|nr:hypothetical protein [Candidatus Woesearchaeota archaeon]
MNKLKFSLIIPVASYILFLLNLYLNIKIASIAFFITVMSTIIIALFAFKGEENVKETQNA